MLNDGTSVISFSATPNSLKQGISHSGRLSILTSLLRLNETRVTFLALMMGNLSNSLVAKKISIKLSFLMSIIGCYCILTLFSFKDNLRRFGNLFKNTLILVSLF
jgi:hypothetical protein